MRARDTWRGHVVSIHVTERGGMPMRALDEAVLVPGVGIEGDRYATGQGHYSSRPAADRQLTLIEIETLEALSRDHGIELAQEQSRRNITVRGVPLNHLVGKTFSIGDAVLFGARLNVPCKYLQKLTGQPVFEPLKNRSGLNCEIRRGGTVRPGDLVQPL